MIFNGEFGKYHNKVYHICFGQNDIVFLHSDNDECLGEGFLMNEGNHSPKYFKRVLKNEIEWFCSISVHGDYKGYDVAVLSETHDKYYIRTYPIEIGNEVFSESKGFHSFDRVFREGYVSKCDVKNMEQIVSPRRHDLKAPDVWDFQIDGDDSDLPRKVLK